jgi:Mor family transcriptional regulator
LAEVEKNRIQNIKKIVENQGVLLKETAAMLNEVQAMLFEMEQGELFSDEGAEIHEDDTDIEHRNEVFEELKELLGNEQAEKVADYFSGSLVYFSKNVITARKYREIKRAYREGASYRDLSIRYGYTEGHIRRIVHKKKKEQRR